MQASAKTDKTPFTAKRGLVRRALLIRRFEEMLLRLFSEGRLNGTVHTCIGQEWSAVSVIAALAVGDTIFSNHRGHGHFLAAHENPRGLLCEIMGRKAGICGGIGGSQHLYSEGFYSNGILGGMSPIAAGFGLAHKFRNNRSISVVFHGDGALGEGVIYETMNWAAKWRIPILWVIERNGVAQSTDCASTISGTVKARAAAFDIPYFHGDTWHVDELIISARKAVENVRLGCEPSILEIETYRLAAHSKGDDDRDTAELRRFKELDPLNILLSSGNPEIAEMDRGIDVELSKALEEAVFSDKCQYNPDCAPYRTIINWIRQPAITRERTSRRFSELINDSFLNLFEKHSTLIMIGEDIEGPYGGAFKVSRDLSQQFPGRVRNTPISEAAIVGMGTGLAMAGMRPVVEIMFGDFLGLAFDQLLQHACKFETMFNGKVRVPLIVRSPMGGRRGYGPTHSQCIESYFLGMPRLTVLALNVRLDPNIVYAKLLGSEHQPTLVIENKILYTRTLRVEPPGGYDAWYSDESFPTIRLRPVGLEPQITIVCYGGTLELVEDVLGRIFVSKEILCEVVCPAQLAPLNLTPIRDSVSSTGRLLVIEEGKTFSAYGSEVIARLVEERLDFHAKRLGYDHLIPASVELENMLLPNVDSIYSAIIELMNE